jgi:hypothetical protein
MTMIVAAGEISRFGADFKENTITFAPQVIIPSIRPDQRVKSEWKFHDASFIIT